MKEAGEPPKAPVSVVIPCYRCADTIARALDSVAAQTRVPAEVILVEDSSRDGTLERLGELAATHPSGWIRVVALSENRGAASARNAGWDVATQPYLAFLDSDDAWHPRKIEIQYEYMAAHGDVALCGHGHMRLEGDPVLAGDIAEVSVAPVSKHSLLLSNNFFAPTVMMLKRDVPFRFLAGRRHVDDHLLWLQLVCAGLTFIRLSARLAYTYKAPFGESGLSSQLWQMEKAELANYWILRRSGCIGATTATGICVYSLAKFLRRLLIVALRRLH